MALSPGEMLAGRYRIEGQIGQGAFGLVYKAWDTNLKRWVAIKELRRDAPDMGSEGFRDYARRFRREAEVQAQFNHPHIVHVYELIDQGDTLYLVMEYADGPNLRDYLKTHGPLLVDEAVRIALEVLDGLGVVHKHPLDIVHRDIKPSNILLTSEGQAKLTDFGLAQVGQESRRSLGAGERHPGTWLYMSSEQKYSPDYLRAPSDLYSLGCVLYEMLAGRLPFLGEGAGQVSDGFQEKPPPLKQVNEAVPPGVEAVILRALAQSPAQRYPTAALMAQALQAAVKQSASAKPAAATDKGGAKPARRASVARRSAWPWLVPVVLVVVAVLVCGIAGAVVLPRLFLTPIARVTATFTVPTTAVVPSSQPTRWRTPTPTWTAVAPTPTETPAPQATATAEPTVPQATATAEPVATIQPSPRASETSETTEAPTSTFTPSPVASPGAKANLGSPTPHPRPAAPAGVMKASSAELQGPFSVDTILPLEHSPYRVKGDVTVAEQVTLIIEPGVILKFEKHGTLIVNGVLKSQGLPGQPIVFTSTRDDLSGDTNGDGAASSPAPGDWAGVSFEDTSVDAESIVEFTEFYYGGLDHWSYNDQNVGTIRLNGASPTIANCQFSRNLNYAISGDLNSFPVVAGSVMNENSGNGLEIRGGTMTLVKAAGHHWSNTDVVYSVTGDVTIPEGVALTMDPGVMVKLGPRVGFWVNGVLRMEGTASQPVTFTSIRDDTLGGDTNGDGIASAPAVGDWAGVHFQDTSVDGNCLVKHAVLKYAGLDHWSYSDQRIGAIRLVSASPTIQDSEFVSCLAYAISGDVNSFPALSGNSFRGNSGNGLEIPGGTLSAVRAEGYRWSNTGVVYALTNDFTISNGVALSVSPGVIVKLGPRVGIYVDGVLRIEGTADKPVILTSLRDDAHGGDTNGDAAASVPAAGDWAGIRFQDASVDANCLVERAILLYGGLDHWSYNDQGVGMINLWQASPTISHCELGHSSAYGIWVSRMSTPIVEGNTFHENAKGDSVREE